MPNDIQYWKHISKQLNRIKQFTKFLNKTLNINGIVFEKTVKEMENFGHIIKINETLRIKLEEHYELTSRHTDVKCKEAQPS